MVRRILIHLAALVVGGSMGLGFGWILHAWLEVSGGVVAIVVGTFIFLFQVLANAITERFVMRREPVIKEPLIRGTEPWGWLRPDNGKGAGFPLNKECTRLGRGIDMDILLNNASISRQHAQIRRLVDGCLLEDIGSRNGIFVNGERVREQTLNDGDSVGLGELKFVYVKMGGPVRRPAPTFAGVEAALKEDGSRGYRSTGEIRASRVPSRETEDEVGVDDDRAARPFDETSDYRD